MKSFKLKTLTAAIVATLTMGVSSIASAVPTFTIDTSAITGGAQNLVTGDFFSGTSSELLTTTGNTHDGYGYLQISSLNLLTTPQIGFGNLGSFGLYVTFHLQDTLSSGTINTANSTYSLTTLDFLLYADPSKDTTFTPAGVSGTTGIPAVVGGITGDDYVLAGGQLITGTAGLTSLGGAFLNSINSFAVCTGAGTADVGGVPIAAPYCASGTGSAFFYAPVPFYELAFTEFNNTSQGFTVSTDGKYLAIQSATGGVDFNRVPEPATLALLGLGMLGMGVIRRRGKA